MDRDQAKDIVKGYLDDYLRGKGINTRLPFRCFNPNHPDVHPSMHYIKNKNHCKCFSCEAYYDIFDLIGIDYGLTDQKDIFNKAYELYNITIDKTEPARKSELKKEEKNKQEDFLAYYEKAKASISDSAAQDYLASRGISNEVAAKYWLGYDAEYNTFNIDPEGQNSYAKWRALIIPTGSGSYIARNIDSPSEPSKRNRYRKKGATLIFNSKALYEADKPIYVTEGEIDALSIIEVGGIAVGLGSVSNCNRLIEQIKVKKPVQPLILCLDQDKEGQRAEEELSKELLSLDVPFYKYNVCGAAKDANEALLLNREYFKEEVIAGERLQKTQKEAVEEAIREDYLKKSAAYSLEEFSKGINESVNTPVISTGFSNLDDILDGGLYEGLYILGAISSLGKTTLALQLADNLAKQERDVLIFSLEMLKHELMAKSISRLTYLLADDNKRNAKTTRGITAGARYKNYSTEEKALINKSYAAYKEFANHIYIHEGIGDIGVEKIKEEVHNHISITGNKPVIIIDYLQILAPYDVRASDKQNIDKAVLELKRLSREKLTVIAISSFNRESYRADGGANRGKVSMTDYKESGALEYSADVLIGLEFEGAGSKDYNEKTEKQRDPRHIRLVVLKNRNGKAWENCIFNYYPLFNYFEEEEKFIPVSDKSDPFAEIRGRAK